MSEVMSEEAQVEQRAPVEQPEVPADDAAYAYSDEDFLGGESPQDDLALAAGEGDW